MLCFIRIMYCLLETNYNIHLSVTDFVTVVLASLWGWTWGGLVPWRGDVLTLSLENGTLLNKARKGECHGDRRMSVPDPRPLLSSSAPVRHPTQGHATPNYDRPWPLSGSLFGRWALYFFFILVEIRNAYYTCTWNKVHLMKIHVQSIILKTVTENEHTWILSQTWHVEQRNLGPCLWKDPMVCSGLNLQPYHIFNIFRKFVLCNPL